MRSTQYNILSWLKEWPAGRRDAAAEYRLP